MKPLPLSRLPVTSARVFAIAGPAMLANLTTPLLGIVGTAAIGRLGEAHLLGGIALSALVFDGAYWLFAFLRMGTVALTAQALGAGDAAEQRAVLLRALLIAALVGVLLIALQAPLASAIYRALGGSDAVRAAAESYFFVRVWSAPCALANFAVLGWLVGIARAGTALALQIAINLVNMARDNRAGAGSRLWHCRRRLGRGAGGNLGLGARARHRLAVAGRRLDGPRACCFGATSSCACWRSIATS